MPRLATLTCVVAAVAGAGCGSDRPSRGEGTVEVVATIAPVANLVSNAGGRRVRVTALVPTGADPHAWRPGPAEREAMARADLVVRAGGAIDAWAEGAGAERELALLALVQPLGGDPHWWQDPVRAQQAAKEVRNELARADVDGAGYYEAATADFLARLRGLDRAIRRCLARVPRPRPRLAAQHDGFAYFSERYGVSVVGPRGRGASAGRRLWADTLGRRGTGADSYLGAMSANAAAIVDGLSGGNATCRPRP
jgi:ABC-type Zn uptake system ZnuABC Zn-binding protein ZnuA